jgi:hypothetical protein
MNIIELWPKLRERKPEAIIALAAVLTTPLFLIVWREWLYGIMARRVESVPPRILGAAVGLLIIWLLASLSFTVLFAFRVKESKRRIFRFGVYWDNRQTPYCPACSKPLSYINESKGFFTIWGFKCAQCSAFIPLNDDDGRPIEIGDARRLLSGGPLEAPELDETSMQILQLVAEPNSKLTAEDLARILNLHPQRMAHYLSNLSKQKYIFATTSWAVPSPPSTYRLNDKGRALLLSKNLI